MSTSAPTPEPEKSQEQPHSPAGESQQYEPQHQPPQFSVPEPGPQQDAQFGSTPDGEYLPTGQSIEGLAPTEQTPTEQTPTEQAPTEQAPSYAAPGAAPQYEPQPVPDAQSWQQYPAQPSTPQPQQGYGQHAGYGRQGYEQSYTAHQQRAPKQNSGEPGFFKALLDFNLENFIAVKFSKVIYIIGIALSVLLWLGGGLVLIVVAAMGGRWLMIPAVLHLVFGWIPASLSIIALRLLLELIIAQVRTAQNTTKLVKSAE